jgi:RNA polymerase sigma-70 factor (ECF subfamily)
MDKSAEIELFEKIKTGDEKAFEILFHKYYVYLCSFATKIISNNAAAEEIVQDFFVKLWERREQLTIETSIKNYLFRSVKNLCINYIQHNRTKIRYTQKVISEMAKNDSDDDSFPEIELARKIKESIDLLPEKRKEIFRLSRQEGLKYHEIATKLNISIKTVETQMGLAIKTLRDKLKNYSSFFTFF